MARSSAAKSAMKRWGSSADSSEIAARRMAAAQPSVRSQRASISASVSSSATSPEHVPRLVDGHRQLGRPDLDELSREAVPVKRDRWVGSRGEDDPQLSWSMLDQMSDVGERRPLVEDVDVVQDQHHRGVVLRDAVDE